MKKERTPGVLVLDGLASYGLCCILLLCLFLLTILGTLYQVDNGLYAAKQRYFLSWFLWWSPAGGMSLPVFPGGILCMMLLAVNMLMGGLFRVRVARRNKAVVVVHLGIVFLLMAGLVKVQTADEGNLKLYEGQELDYFQNEYLWEVAVWEIGTGREAGEFVIEDPYFSDLTEDATRTFTSRDLPFDLVLSTYLPNSRVLPKGPNWTATGPVVDGYGLKKEEPAGEGFRDIPGLLAEVRVGGESQRGILWGFEELPWAVRAAGKDWALALRPARYPMPFSIRLDKFEKEDHPGMMMAKAYRSTVTKSAGGESERVLIQMNEPLRHEGLVLFQSGFGPNPAGPNDRLFSIFSVVRNPSDKWPEYSLWVITFGLVWAFGRKLFGWIRLQYQKRAIEGGAA